MTDAVRSRGDAAAIVFNRAALPVAGAAITGGSTAGRHGGARATIAPERDRASLDLIVFHGAAGTPHAAGIHRSRDM